MQEAGNRIQVEVCRPVIINRPVVRCTDSSILRGKPMAMHLGKIVEFDVDGVVLQRRIVLTAMDRDHEISQASPVGHFVGNTLPGTSGVVHTPGGDAVVKVLAVIETITESSVPLKAA